MVAVLSVNLTATTFILFHTVTLSERRDQVAREDQVTPIEKMLGFEFVSDPRLAKYPLPETPADHLAKRPDRPFPHPSMVITPDMARDILKYRVVRIERMPRDLRHPEITGNRRFLMATLNGTKRNKGLVATIRDGEWDPRISTPAVFTQDGFVLDSQHRIAGCFLSGTAIEMPVTTNGQWGTFSVLDIGRGRNAGQLLGDLIPYPDHSAAAAKLILPVIRGNERSEWSAADASNQEIYELVHGWDFFQETQEGHGSWMKHVLQASASRIPLSALAASTMMALAAGADAFHVQQFLDGLKPGYREGFPMIGDRGEDPRHLLRKQYLNKKSSSRKATDKDRRDQVSHVRRAMEVWLEWRGLQEKGVGSKIELEKLQAAAENDKLPAVWGADRVRQFHNERVS